MTVFVDFWTTVQVVIGVITFGVYVVYLTFKGDK